MAARIGGAAIAGSPMFSGGNAPSRSSLRIEDRRYTVLPRRTLQETAAAITRPVLTIPRYPGKGEFEVERVRDPGAAPSRCEKPALRMDTERHQTPASSHHQWG